ncbi:MAG TPA: DDE-type integrase/transposase/recombinase [Blastocatellia bacterium]|nr:DDE-type integrase/transposase/recombinase [Blastocatellia bacterium]
MAVHRLAKNMHILIRGREYVIKERLADSKIQIEDLATQECMAVEGVFLREELFNGHAELLGSAEEQQYRERQSKKRFLDDVRMVKKKLRRKWRRRLKYIKVIIAEGVETLTPRSLQPISLAVAEKINDPEPPSWRTLSRWVKAYLESGGDTRSLMPAYKLRGNRNRKFSRDATKCADILRIIEECINEKYLTRQRHSIQFVYDIIRARIERDNRHRNKSDRLPCPHYDSVRRIIRSLDHYEVTKARYGERIADLRFKETKRGPRPTRPLERVEIDHTKLDLFVIDHETRMPVGRPWLTVAVDVFTDVILGFYLSFDPPGYLSVMQCLLHSVRPKPYVRKKYPQIKHVWEVYGVPETIIVDNGKEFHSRDFEDACLQLGILIQYAPPKLPYYKGTVERYFGTLNRGLLHGQPGTSFSNAFEKADYDPKKNAVISFETLDEILHTFVIDIYHQSKHRGINDVPARLWNSSVVAHPPALPQSSKDLDVLLGKVLSRKVSSKGIEFEGLYYNSKALSLLRRRSTDGKLKVKIKLDPTNISVLHVYDQLKDEFFPLPAVNQEYTQNLTLWQHRVIKRYAQQQVNDFVDIADLCLAKERIQEIVSRDWKSAKKSATRQKMARWLSLGKQPQEKSFDDQMTGNGNGRQQELPQANLNSAHSGVSDLGSAFNVQNESIERSDIEGQILTDIKKRPSKKSKRVEKVQKRATKSRKALNPAPLEADETDLDMSGWTAGFNLPK